MKPSFNVLLRRVSWPIWDSQGTLINVECVCSFPVPFTVSKFVEFDLIAALSPTGRFPDSKNIHFTKRSYSAARILADSYLSNESFEAHVL